MRSSFFARVVFAGLAVSVLITLGCGEPPTAPSGMPKGPHASMFATVSISPTEGPSVSATAVTIKGVEFQSDTTVTVDGNRVDATVVDAKTISLVMPAHAGGKVDLNVIRAPGHVPISVRPGFTYIGAPVISELLPNIGSTGGGTQMVILGRNVWDAQTVTFGGIVVSNLGGGWDADELYLTTPAHAAGTVDVIVTDRYGQTGSAVFTYASPATFDFNGDWQGWAENLTGSDSSPLVLTIRDNIVVSVSCGSSSLTLDPPPVVANGEFSFAGVGGVSITGKIVSPKSASGTINTALCVNRSWRADNQK
jgi:hypothetical protein